MSKVQRHVMLRKRHLSWRSVCEGMYLYIILHSVIWRPSQHQSGARDDTICSINTFAHFAQRCTRQTHPSKQEHAGKVRGPRRDAYSRLLGCENDTCRPISNTILSPNEERASPACVCVAQVTCSHLIPNATQPATHPTQHVTRRHARRQHNVRCYDG